VSRFCFRVSPPAAAVSFQQGANHPDGKAIAGADGIDDVIHFYRRNGALFAVGGFIPGAVGAGFNDDRANAVVR
jgi:hypothetical protein